jgi:hypothetical protein
MYVYIGIYTYVMSYDLILDVQRSMSRYKSNTRMK